MRPPRKKNIKKGIWKFTWKLELKVVKGKDSTNKIK
jgi:hypothetical protein